MTDRDSFWGTDYRRFIWLTAVGVLFWSAVLWFFPDARTRQLLRATWTLGVACACLAVPVGAVAAWLLTRVELPGRRALAALLFLALLLPLYLQAAVWEAGFGQLGWFQLAFRPQRPPLLSGWIGALWVHTLAAIPWSMLCAWVHLKLVQPDLEDVTRLELSAPSAVLHLLQSQLRPALGISFVWIVVWVSGEITVTDLFLVRTFAEEVYLGFATEPAGGLTAAAPTAGVKLGFVLATTAMVLLVGAGYRTEVEQLEARPITAWKLGPWTWPAFAGLFGLVALLTLTPIVNLAIKSGMTAAFEEGEWTRRWSLIKTLQMIGSSPVQFRHELGWSLIISQLASLLSLVFAIAMLTASRLRNGGRILGWLTAVMAALSISIPGPVLGVWVVHWFTALPDPLGSYLYSRTIAAPVCALTIKCFPLVLGLLWAGLQLAPQRLLEAARTEGANLRQQWLHVWLPSHGMLLLCIFFLGALYAMGDVAASILVVPPGVMTLGISIFSMVHSGTEDRLAGLCLAMILMTAAIGKAAVVALKRFLIMRC